MARDITTLPAGRTRIDGDKAVVTVSTVTPQTSDKALFQRHDNHITLETDLDGSELFEVSLAEQPLHCPVKPDILWLSVHNISFLQTYIKLFRFYTSWIKKLGPLCK